MLFRTKSSLLNKVTLRIWGYRVYEKKYNYFINNQKEIIS